MSASTPTPRTTSPLTVSAVPPGLPPRTAADPMPRNGERPAHRTRAWTPRTGHNPAGGAVERPAADRPPADRSLGERARAERRREEERHVRSLARIVALACVEAELGLRPARQLSAWLDLPTYGKMVRRADLASRIRADGDATQGRPQALGARCCHAEDGVYEASATIQLPDRVRAMALRIERRRDRWKVTALELG